jgi:molybdate/tungstate transport system ATP-binding protein
MIRTVSLNYDVGVFKLTDMDFHLEKGKYFVLLGPPGSGKTVFLECICGLRRPSSGQIYIGDRNVTTVLPRNRHLGYVPQDYALFPHLSVKQNIAFGLRYAGIKNKQVYSNASKTAELLGITHLLDRSIAGLSGGEKQRTALARALVTEPDALLLDEPVCALDEAMRQSVCALLRDIQKGFNLTTIHVSHNLEEAFSVADSAGVLKDGVLQQQGPLPELLRKPKNEFVAQFMRCQNIFTAKQISTSAEGFATVDLRGIQLRLPSGKISSGHEVKFMIRPEDVLVFGAGSAPENGDNRLQMNLASWRDYGAYVKLELKGPIDLVAHLTHAAFAELKASPAQPLTAVLRAQNMHILED